MGTYSVSHGDLDPAKTLGNPLFSSCSYGFSERFNVYDKYYYKAVFFNTLHFTRVTMNKFKLILGIVVLVPSIAVPQNAPKNTQAERNMPVECDSTEKIMTALKDQFKETPLMVGKSTTKKSYTSIWGNPETKTFTVLTTRGDVTCVLDVGTDLEVVINSDKSV